MVDKQRLIVVEYYRQVEFWRIALERLIIYGLVIINIIVGFIIYYRKPSPFGKKTYDK